MNAATVLRIAVISELVLIPLGLGISYWAEGFAPRDLLELEDNQTSYFTISNPSSPVRVLLMVALAVCVGLWIASVVGLLKLKRWGAWLYLAGFVAALPVFLLMGFEIRYPVVQVFDEVRGAVTGLIIGLAFFSGAIPRNGRGENHPT